MNQGQILQGSHWRVSLLWVFGRPSRNIMGAARRQTNPEMDRKDRKLLTLEEDWGTSWGKIWELVRRWGWFYVFPESGQQARVINYSYLRPNYFCLGEKRKTPDHSKIRVKERDTCWQKNRYREETGEERREERTEEGREEGNANGKF